MAKGNGKILSARSSREMTTTTLKNGIAALGMFIEDQNGEKYMQHSGANSGFRGKYYFGVSNGKGVVVMVNGTNTEIIEEIIRSVAFVYDWPGFAKIESSVGTGFPESMIKSFAGTYRLGNRSINIRLERKRLIAQEKNKWQAELTAITTSKFIVGNLTPQTTMEFIKDENGKVIKLIIHQGDFYEWEKVY